MQVCVSIHTHIVTYHISCLSCNSSCRRAGIHPSLAFTKSTTCDRMVDAEQCLFRVRSRKWWRARQQCFAPNACQMLCLLTLRCDNISSESTDLLMLIRTSCRQTCDLECAPTPPRQRVTAAGHSTRCSGLHVRGHTQRRGLTGTSSVGDLTAVVGCKCGGCLCLCVHACACVYVCVYVCVRVRVYLSGCLYLWHASSCTGPSLFRG